MTAPSGVSTVVASANLARVDGRPARAGGSAFEQLSIGQNLKLQVLRQLEQQRYEVTFGGRRHVVESRVPLEVGTQVEAQVEATGDKLELRFLRAGPRFDLPNGVDAPAQESPADGADAASVDGTPIPAWLNALAQQYRVPLDALARSTIARAAAEVGDPELMTRGGLYLQKLAQSVSPQDLETLYRALSAADRAPPASLAQAPIVIDDLPDNDDVAAALADALDAAMPEPAGAGVAPVGGETDADGGTQDDAQRALRLLNIQDEGSVAWRYGTLPLLVGGQLVELDLVMFREREQPRTRGALRRLVMTLDTTHFGRVHVEARAVDSRIIVKLSAASSDAVEILSAYGNDVRAAIEQLGWAVDDVRYEIDSQGTRAAHAVVHHVLSAGSVDQEL
jgi:hypothetical protein